MMMIPKSVTDGWEAEVNDLKSALAAEKEKVRKLRTAIVLFFEGYTTKDQPMTVYGLNAMRAALLETADKEG